MKRRLITLSLTVCLTVPAGCFNNSLSSDSANATETDGTESNGSDVGTNSSGDTDSTSTNDGDGPGDEACASGAFDVSYFDDACFM